VQRKVTRSKIALPIGCNLLNIRCIR